MTGKERRLGRLLKGPERRCLLVPLDHGPWLGPVRGIECPKSVVREVLAGGANALLITPGVVRAVESITGPSVGIVLRVSITLGLAPEAKQETPVATVDTALRMDADAVAVSIFFGRGQEVSTMRFLGELTEQCARYGVPVLAEMMPTLDDAYDPEAIAHAARIGFEMGADMIKTNYCGDVAAFEHVVASSPVPIVVAGGPRQESGKDGTFQMVREIIEAGAAGVAIGRRVWQSEDPQRMVREIHSILFPSGADSL
ncbi:MAG TPA: 2-amino-3,7-dideoxy-D-threo-hept-6-ulosonate synthase [Anaerolineae bacterium]|nr:2-amino-3,7-dideoxy-D-threo-hept-6-ulosonate synthase [Anaerolineae bacterium]